MGMEGAVSIGAASDKVGETLMDVSDSFGASWGLSTGAEMGAGSGLRAGVGVGVGAGVSGAGASTGFVPMVPKPLVITGSSEAALCSTTVLAAVFP
jgi:hypothetical protein